MHIAEGILPIEWAAAWAVPAAAGVAIGVRRVNRQIEREPNFKSLVALAGAAVFALSLMPIPVPVAGSVSHPAGTPLAAVLVGPAGAVVLATVSLLLQALFFAHGGLSTLGANAVSEGLVGALVGFGVFALARRSGRSLFVAGFLGGALGDLAVYMTTALELALGLFPVAELSSRFTYLFAAFLPTQLPLAIGEGLLTGAVLRSLAELRPDLARRLSLVGPGEGSAKPGTGSPRDRLAPRRALTGLALGALVLLLAAAVLAGGNWVGLDQGVIERTAEEAGRAARDPWLPLGSDAVLPYVFMAGGLISGALLGRVGPRVFGLRSGGAAPLLMAAAGLLSTAILLAAGGEDLLGKFGDAGLAAFLAAGLLLGAGVAWSGSSLWGPPWKWVGGLFAGLSRHAHVALHHGRGLGPDALKRTPLVRLDARLKLGFVLALVLVNLMAPWQASVAILLASVLLLLVLEHVSAASLALRLAPGVMVAALLLLVRGLTEPGRPLFDLGLPLLPDLVLTAEGTLAGAQLGITVMAGLGLILALGMTTPTPQAVAALRWFRVPELFTDVGSLMYRYLFLFIEEGGRLRQAERLRRPEQSLAGNIRGLGARGAKLMASSMERSERVHAAQQLRRPEEGAHGQGTKGERAKGEAEHPPSSGLLREGPLAGGRVLLEGVGYRYPDGVVALAGIDLEVEAGSFVALMGANGSGKSTLLKLAATLFYPTEGRVSVDGIQTSREAFAQVARRVGYLFQDPNDQLFRPTVAEDIGYGIEDRVTPEEVNRRVQWAAELCGVAEVLERPIHALSYGQKKRVALAGILVCDPSVLLLDEPTASLDPMAEGSLMRLLRHLNRRGLTVVMATHDVDLIPLYADAIVLLRRGSVARQGPLEEVFSAGSHLESCDLRLPRISYLFDIFCSPEERPLTVGQARKALVRMVEKGELDLLPILEDRTRGAG